MSTNAIAYRLALLSLLFALIASQACIGTAVAYSLTVPLALQATTNCQAAWQPTFGVYPGVDDTVLASVVFDDGNGEALYVGGSFTHAGGVAANHIAKWDGARWSPLGSGLDNQVLAMTVFDDGTGMALYVGGYFHTAGSVATEYIAKWNGTTWSKPWSGTGPNAFVSAMAAFNGALHIGGGFTTISGATVRRIARLNGTGWSSLGAGLNNVVQTLKVHDDGGGSCLYVGGDFTDAGGIPANGIARWDGTAWSGNALFNNGVTGGSVRVLESFNDGSGPALYVGGFFNIAGGVAAKHIAMWTVGGWAGLGTGTNGTFVGAIEVFDDGTGPALHVGGNFLAAGAVLANYVAKWQFSTWSALGSGADNMVMTLCAFHEHGADRLFAAGFLTELGDVLVNGGGAWNGSSWKALGAGFNNPVYSLAEANLGTGSCVYIGGSFRTAGGVAANNVVKWDGVQLSPLGSGMYTFGDGSFDTVLALAGADIGSGPRLYAGGKFSKAGGLSVNKVAAWNGTAWSGMGSGMNGEVRALASYNDGTGLAIFAAGQFTSAGGVQVKNIAKWNGSNWSVVGTAPNNGTNAPVNALAVFDSGAGPELYAAGEFTAAAGVVCSYIARWNGTSWAPVGPPGLNAFGSALAIHNDGTGSALYVGGGFQLAGGIGANRIARWSAAGWQNLGSGMNGIVRSLASFDGGGGSGLYAGGEFTTAGGGNATRIAKWENQAWSALGGGKNNVVQALLRVESVGPISSALLAGGQFTATPPDDSYAGVWRCLVPPASVYCTAKVNSLGCTPSIDSTGIPSATATSGHVVKAVQERNNKNGLLFYGTTGQASGPFQGGTLCVKTPIRRTGAVQSGGNPAPANDCSGAYQIDMNAFAQSTGPPTPLAALKIPGTVVNCQFWGRDPGFPAPDNTTLSDGLEYTVGP